jgi:hypothetical protein
MSTCGWCDKLLVVVLMSESNSGEVSTFDKIFTKITLEESLSCKCYNNEALISCCAKGVSFKDKIFYVDFKFLSPKGLLVWVHFWGFSVVFDVRSMNVHLPDAEDGGNGFNWPKVKLLNVSNMVFDSNLSSCGWFFAPTQCFKFGLSSIPRSVALWLHA